MHRVLFVMALWLSLLGTGWGQMVIDGPDQVEVGKPQWYRIDVPAGSSVFWYPSLDLETGGIHIHPSSALFWTRTPGKYIISALVIHWETKQGSSVSKKIVVAKGPGNDDDDTNGDDNDDDSPSELSAFTADLVDELGIIIGTARVADFFLEAIPKIDDGSLRGSKAIVEAVTKRIADMESVKWRAFSSLLYSHLLNDLKLVTQTQWSDAYKQVALGLGGAKP